MGLELSKSKESEFLPGAGRVPLYPLPRRENGASFWSLLHSVPKARRGRGPAGRSPRAQAGAPGAGTQ